MLYNTGAIRVIYLLHFHFQRFHCNHSPVVHGAMGCGQKSYKASVAVPPVPVQVPSQMQLAPSVTSVTSVANDRVIMRPVVHGAIGCGQNRFKLVWRCHQFLSGFLGKGHFSECRVSHVCQKMVRTYCPWSHGLRPKKL